MSRESGGAEQNGGVEPFAPCKESTRSSYEGIDGLLAEVATGRTVEFPLRPLRVLRGSLSTPANETSQVPELVTRAGRSPAQMTFLGNPGKNPEVFAPERLACTVERDR